MHDARYSFITLVASLHFRSMERSINNKSEKRGKTENGLTSPAPRKRNLCSGKVPPMSFRAATTPARTTDAVP